MVGNILSGWNSNPKLPLQYCQEKVDEQSLVRLLTSGGKSDSLSQANMALVKPEGILSALHIFGLFVQSIA